MDMSVSKLRELVMDREAFAVHRAAKGQTRVSNWTELNWIPSMPGGTVLCVQEEDLDTNEHW